MCLIWPVVAGRVEEAEPWPWSSPPWCKFIALYLSLARAFACRYTHSTVFSEWSCWWLHFFRLNLQLRNAVSTLASEGFVSLHGDTVKRVWGEGKNWCWLLRLICQSYNVQADPLSVTTSKSEDHQFGYTRSMLKWSLKVWCDACICFL